MQKGRISLFWPKCNFLKNRANFLHAGLFLHDKYHFEVVFVLFCF